MQIVGLGALDELAAVVEAIVIRYVEGQSLTGKYQRVVSINFIGILHGVPYGVLLEVLHTDVGAVAHLEELVQTSVDTGIEDRALHSRLLYQTLLLVVVVRHIVVYCLATALHGGIDIISRSRAAQHLVIPVGIEAVVLDQIADFVAHGLTDNIAELYVLLRVHHLCTVGSRSRNTPLGLDANLGALVVTTLLRGDKDHTVGSTRTVDRSKSSILEHGEIGNVLRVEGAEE